VPRLCSTSASVLVALDLFRVVQEFNNDPFDRLLVATALTEPYRLLTHDAHLAAYWTIVTVV
jgi:PIN domain nuclease of toxin-antitoxin system